MNRNYWKNRKVLITGYEGFLGSNLTKKLVDAGAKIVGLDIRIGRKETILTAGDLKKIRVVRGDVANYKLCKKIIRDFKIQTVFHLAAEAIVGEALKNPLRAFESNIKGTWALLEACRGVERIEAIVIASSDKAYGSHAKLPYTESAPLIGNQPYDVSKSCADLLASTYHHTYELPVSITRCGNIFGEGDFNFSRIVPDAIKCALLGDTLYIRSDGRYTRDYIYVGDIVDGYIFLAEKLQKFKLAGEAFNFSNETPMTVIELVKKIALTLKTKPDYKILNEARYEIRHQYLSSAKARRILGWKPKYSLAQGLSMTVSWYKSNLIHG